MQFAVTKHHLVCLQAIEDHACQTAFALPLLTSRHLCDRQLEDGSPCDLDESGPFRQLALVNSKARRVEGWRYTIDSRSGFDTQVLFFRFGMPFEFVALFCDSIQSSALPAFSGKSHCSILGLASMNFERHIAIDLRMYRMAGIGRYLRNLLPDLIPRLNASRITILGKSDDLAGEEWFSDPRVQFREFRPRIFSLAEQWAALWGEYRGINLLWIPQYNLPLLYQGKVLVTVHDLCQVAKPETLANELQRRYAKYLFSKVAKRASAILCVSEFTASELQKYFRVDRERVVVAYPAIGNMWSISETTQPTSSNSPFLLAVGSVKKHKNLPRLIAAFSGVRNQIPHDLIIVGKQHGFLNSETQLQSISEALNGRVRFTGHVTDQQLTFYYRNATAIIFPSLYEGFGFPLVEAMAEGCPIACSNISSLPEVAGDAALLFDPYNVEDIGRALLQIATEPTLRSMLAERGRERIRRFVGTTCAEVTAATINRLLEV